MILPDSDPKQYHSLILGVLLLGLALMETLSGEALGRFGRTVTRFEQPKKFRQLVAIEYIFAALSIGYFLYEKYLAK